METREDTFKDSENTSIFLESGSEESELPIQLIHSIQLKGNVLASDSNKGILTAQAISPTRGPRCRTAGKTSSVWPHFLEQGEKKYREL